MLTCDDLIVGQVLICVHDESDEKCLSWEGREYTIANVSYDSGEWSCYISNEAWTIDQLNGQKKYNDNGDFLIFAVKKDIPEENLFAYELSKNVKDLQCGMENVIANSRAKIRLQGTL